VFERYEVGNGLSLENFQANEIEVRVNEGTDFSGLQPQRTVFGTKPGK
jgi:hypothetical protein